MQQLIDEMLKGGNPLTVGVGIVIEVIRKNNSDYDPEVGDSDKAPTSRDPIYLGSLLGLFAKYIPDFVALMLSPKHTIGSVDGPVVIARKELGAAFGGKIEPLGFDRFKTCELMAELLHCSNMGLLNEVGAEAFIAARDAEREKMRAEGAFNPSTSYQETESDGVTIRSPNSSRLGSNSPEDLRRLEIQNGSDDDGFEQVSHPHGHDDDTSDPAPKSNKSDDTADGSKSSHFSSFLDKDDDQFVGEPLTSPRLGTDDMTDPSLQVKPLSPVKQLTDKTGQLDVNADNEKPPSYDDHSKDAAIPTGTASVDAQASSSKDEKTMSDASAIATTQPEGITPHPDDQPAPLFSNKKADTPAGEKSLPAVEMPSEDSVAKVPLPEENAASTHEDSTIVDHGETSNLDNSRNSIASNAFDFDHPVVGDYLKMQFVEHKVVPTILVSIHALFSLETLTNLLPPGLLFQIPMEQLPTQCCVRCGAAGLQWHHDSRVQP